MHLLSEQAFEEYKYVAEIHKETQDYTNKIIAYEN